MWYLRSLAIFFLGVNFTLAVGAQTPGDIKRSYDRFKDKTTISSTIAKAAMSSDYTSESWSVSTTFDGEKMPEKPVIEIFLLTSSKEWQFLRTDLTLRSIIEGERVTLGEMKRVFSDAYRGSVIEGLKLLVPVETIVKMGNAKKIEVQVGFLEKSFSESEILRIKEFSLALKNP